MGFSRAATFRNLSAPALKAVYQLHEQGSDLVPLSGPLILLIEGDGLLVVPVLKALTPRPVHVVVAGALGQVLAGHSSGFGGDVTLISPGFEATQEALSYLQEGQAVGIMGDFPLVGYLIAMTGARVQPVAISGAGGKVATDPPRPRSKVGILYDAPLHISPNGDPCALATIQQVGEQVRQARVDARTK
jgi:hypothetical protein